MRLVVVNPTGVLGGAEVFLARLAEALVTRGWSVDLMAPEGELVARARGLGVGVFEIPDLKLASGPRAIAALRTAVRWMRASRRIRAEATAADVVLVNGVLALPAVRLARARTPVVWIAHDVIERSDRRALVRATKRAVTHTVAPSRAVARNLDSLGVHSTVIPHGTPWPVAPAPRTPLEPPVVGLVATLTRWKGQDVLLEAMAAIARQDAIIELVGAPMPKDLSYERELRQRAAQPDLAGRVQFAGQVDDVLERLRGWSVAVSASVEPEAVGLSILEAMSVGVPVVVTEHGGPPEFVDGAGVLVPPQDPTSLGAAIEMLLDDDGLRERCASAGRRVASERTLDRELDALDALLQDTARRARTRVVVVVPDFLPTEGGTTVQARAIAQGLQRRGHRVEVLARRRARSFQRREVIDGMAVRRVGPSGIGRRVGEKVGVLAIGARLLRLRPDAVCVIMYPDFAVAAGLAGRARRTLMCWAGTGDATDTIGPVHGVVRGMLRSLRRKILARGRSLVLTAAMRSELAQLGIEAEVVPLPLDRSRFRPPTDVERTTARERLDLAPDDFVVVFSGHLRRLKAVDRLVDAVGMLRAEHPNVKLLLVGGPSKTADRCEDELRAQVEREGLGDTVRFVGAVSDVEHYLWAGDAFAFPSTREGMSFALIEAMATGLPCVAPAEPVGAEILGDAGIVTSDNRSESLAEALDRLMADGDLRDRLGAAATEASAAWDGERILDLYEQLLFDPAVTT